LYFVGVPITIGYDHPEAIALFGRAVPDLRVELREMQTNRRANRISSHSVGSWSMRSARGPQIQTAGAALNEPTRVTPGEK